MGGVNSLCIGRCRHPSDTPENHLHWRRPPRPLPPSSLQCKNGAAAKTPGTPLRVDAGEAAPAAAESDASAVFGDLQQPPPSQPTESLPARPSRWSLRESFGGKSGKSHRRNLSAAFSQISSPDDPDDPQRQRLPKFELLELNSASEEQFMTLPGVNRTTAGNIVAYRRQIGAFRRVEDLALVPGIGGDKLRLLRPEVCVRAGSPSPQSAASPTSANGGAKPLALNSANLFQLMRLPGVSQSTAESIIGERQRRGGFRSLDEVAALHGVGWGLLAGLRGRLCLDAPEEEPASDLPAGGIGRFSESQLCLLAECRIFDRPYARPPTCAAFDGLLAGRPTVRIAAWNLNRLNLEKASNPGVMEVICCTLLENAISVLAVQELTEPAALQRICDELNQPSLPAVLRWRGGDRGHWTACVSEAPVGRAFQAAEFGGFLWRAGPQLRFRQAAPLEKPGAGGRAFTRSPFVAQLSIGGCRLLAASLHLKATTLGGDSAGTARTESEADFLPDLADALASVAGSDARCLLLGDFNLAPDHAAFEPLRLMGYSGLLAADEPTNISRECPAGSRSYDNLWASPLCKRLFTGQAAVVRNGLFHPLIPANWSFGGPVSDHCPVYAEFYSDAE
ncbi:hypothetical protein BOX15_Mlig001509g7 [Macrostomum lignano]|uniref:Endonuclease/exonuclease/phosphatase family domain-containing protein 1 n=1 Tax=Macrostomum lignano TaxID=282301 RepID=A0A267G934_9PLAT|nr:hypothetical protein BOX15_Mlig001509g7 [Macrostomum lignano]